MGLVKLAIFITIVVAAATAFADTITLRNGQVISGTYLGGTARQVQIQVGNQIRTVDTNTIARIDFGGGAQVAPISSYPDDGRPTLRRRDDAQPSSDDSASTPPNSGRPTQPSVALWPPPSSDSEGSGQPTLSQSGSSSNSSGPVLVRANRASAAPPPTPTDSDRPTLKRADSATPAASTAPASASPAASATPASVSPAPVSPASVTPKAGSLELPAGTNLTVRLVQPVDSEKDKVGATFSATIDAPVVKAGNTVIPKGAEALVKLGDSGESGTIALTVVSVNVNGRICAITTETLLRDSDSGGKRVKVPAGTVLSFALDAPADF